MGERKQPSTTVAFDPIATLYVAHTTEKGTTYEGKPTNHWLWLPEITMAPSLKQPERLYHTITTKMSYKLVIGRVTLCTYSPSSSFASNIG